MRGGEGLVNADFAAAFFVIAAVGLISTAFYMRLPANAGANLSGHLET